MSEHSPSSQEVLELDAVTGSVRLPASWVEIVQTRREGDDLVVQLVDGRTLLVPDFFSIAQAVALVREPTGVILALDITPQGESQGVRSVSLSWLEEMFGIEPEEQVAAELDAVEDSEEEPAEESAEDQADEAAAVAAIEEEAEPDQVAAPETQPDSSVAATSSDEDNATSDAPREPKSAGSYVDEIMVASAVLGVAALVGGDEESTSPLAVDPALKPALPDSEVVERGITKTEQARVFNIADWAIPDAARIPSEADVVWTPASGREGTTLQANFDLDGDGAVDAQTRIHFNADYVATGVDFDDNYDGSTDRSVAFTVNESGQHTLARYDDDGDGSYDRAEAYGTDSDGNRVVQHDDDYRGAFLADRIETITQDADGTTVAEIDENGDGSPDRIERRFLDRSETLSEVWVFDLSDGNPEDIDARKTYHYNEIGLLERVDHDEYVDGTVDRSEFYFGGDGEANRSESYFLDSQGRLVAISYDDDNDGNPDWTAVLGYGDAAGGSAISGRAVNPDPREHATGHRATSITIDEDYDRIIDRSEQYEYVSTGYARGRVAAITYDNDHSNDGTFELRETFEYDRSSPQQSQPLRKYVDQFADGTFERVEQYRYSEGLADRVERIEYDDSYDGTSFQSDRAEDIEYNSRGAVSRTRYDDDNDGDADRIEEYRYGLDARVSEVRFDGNADGIWDSIERHRWNGNGKRAGRVYDSDADGTPDRAEAYQYNIKGRLGAIQIDDDADGTVDSSVAIAYNARGQESARLHDDDIDGTANRIDTYSYSGQGVLERLTTQTDHNDNGYTNYERIDTFLYNGGILTSHRVQYDPDEDGSYERDEVTLYSAEGVRYDRTIRRDTNDDGTFNSVERTEWSLSDDSYRITVSLYPDSSLVGSPNRMEVRQYDEQGTIDTGIEYFDYSRDGDWDEVIRTTYANGLPHILEIFEDFDGTMAADRIIVYEYDSEGSVARAKYDDDADGQGTGDFERIETYTGRNSRGDLTSVSYDDNADGVIDRTEVREYNADNLHERSTFLIDENNDLVNERRETLTYNQLGQIVRAEYDGANGPDGSPDALGWVDPTGASYGTVDGTTDWSEETVWFGSAVGRKTLHFHGFVSGAIEKTEVHHFEQGAIGRIDHYGRTLLDGTADSLGEIDPDGTVYGTSDGTADGSPDWTEDFDYAPMPGVALRTTSRYYVAGNSNPKAEVVREDYTDGSFVQINRWDDEGGTADGTMDRAQSRYFAADGQLAYVLDDSNNDGTWESRGQFTFNEQNVATESFVTEYGSDGRAIVRTIASVFEVTPNSRQLREETVTDYSDGGTNADRIVTTRYLTSGADRGKPEQTLVDTNGDGLWETDTVSSYSATGRTDLVSYHLHPTDDSIVNRGERQTFNEVGHLTGIEHDMDYNGTEADFSADATTEHAYEANGRRTVSRFDLNADGTVDIAYSYSYDASGTRESVGIHNDGTISGSADRSETMVYNDDSGLPSQVEYDYDNDSTVDARAINRYDDSGRLIVIRHNDGSSERTETRTFNVRDQIASIARDFDGNGTADALEENRYDSSGRLSRILYDDNHSDDGVYERIVRIVYSNGQIERIQYDMDADSAIDFEVDAFGYDSLGRRVSETTSESGVATRTDTIEYEGNSQRLARRTISWRNVDGDGDGTPGVIERREYDAFGRVTRVEYYDNIAAIASNDEDRIVSYTYNGSTNLVATANFDIDGDGTVSRHATYTYGTNNRLQSIAVNLDLDDDGTTDESETYTYTSDRTVTIEYDGTDDRVEYLTYAGASIQSPSLPGTDVEVPPSVAELASLRSVLEGVARIAHGRIERLATNHISNSNDVTIDEVETYYYNQGGDLIRTDIDMDNDGTVDRRQHISEGDFNWLEVDHNDDGTFDEVYRDVEFDEEGRASVREYSDIESAPDFEVNITEFRLYESASDSLPWAHVRDLDGDPDYDTMYVEFSGGTLEILPTTGSLFPHLETIDLGGLTLDGSSPSVTLDIDSETVRNLAGGADGTIDNRYNEESPYVLRIISNRASGLNLASSEFARDDSADSGDLQAYRASSNDLLVVLVDPDITVTLA